MILKIKGNKNINEDIESKSEKETSLNYYYLQNYINIYLFIFENFYLFNIKT